MRLGLLSYINSLPVTWGLESGVTGFSGQLVAAQPSVLNRMTEERSLDVTPVSSIQWLRCCGHYRVVPGVGIASHGPVQSVQLFSRVPIAQLGREDVAVTGASASSRVLLRILKPELNPVPLPLLPTAYEEARDLTAPSQLLFPEGYRAVLWIGDRALQFSKHNQQWVDRLDLGAAWRASTGLPIVYALWVCRRDLDLNPVRIELERSLAWGEIHLAEVVREAQQRLPLSRAEMHDYYAGLRFRLGAAELEGLLEFYARAAQVGEVEPLSLAMREEILGFVGVAR